MHKKDSRRQPAGGRQQPHFGLVLCVLGLPTSVLKKAAGARDISAGEFLVRCGPPEALRPQLYETESILVPCHVPPGHLLRTSLPIAHCL